MNEFRQKGNFFPAKSKAFGQKKVRNKTVFAQTNYSIQLGLRSDQKPDLTIAPVPENLALDSDRFYLYYGNWYLAIQLSRGEAYALLERLSRLDWELDDRGIPENLHRIWLIASQTIEGGAR